MNDNKSYSKLEKAQCKKCGKKFWKQGKYNFYCKSCKRKARNIRIADINENPNFIPKKNRSCIKKSPDKN